MTNLPKPEADLKRQNEVHLSVFVLANLAVFGGVIFVPLEGAPGFLRWLADNWKVLAATGLGTVLAKVLTSVASPEIKAALVYWRWPFPLPGHRAFTEHLHGDPRIDPIQLSDRLGKLPREYHAQNRLWYELYRRHRTEPAVTGANRDFLLTRDMTSLALASLVILGASAVVVGTSARQVAAYVGCLVLQLVITTLAARNSGLRLVRNVLAVECSAAAKTEERSG